MNNTPNKNENNKNQQGNKFPNLKKPQTITLWVVLLLFVIIIYNMLIMNKGTVREIGYSDFISMTDSKEVVRVIFDVQDVTFYDAIGTKYHTYLPFKDPELVKSLQEKGIIISSSKPSRMMGILFSWLPFIIIIAFWIFMMRSMQGGGGKAFSFGKSKAKLFQGGKTNKTFDDVAGVEEAKEELEEIVEFLKEPKKFQRLGGKIPRGVLLLGRPGTGKTLLAKAVAGEAKVPFFSMSGSDFVEMFVGVGASRVRDLFENAKKHAPCIAFIDEIDAVGRHRGSGIGGGHDEREQTLNQLLVEMDGFEENDSVIIIAATNRPDVLDPALLRPGRFDRQVVVDLPDIKGREQILIVHTKPLPISKDVNIQILARSTSGFSGADLANLANEAALMAARRNVDKIEMIDFEEARDKVTMGKARKSKVITEERKKTTAYHEIGHVLCSIFQEKTLPIHKVTIIPRGFAAGYAESLAEDDLYYTKTYFEQTIITSLGGRAAEKLIFNEFSAGASSDIEQVTNLAKNMVCNWGMSEKIGPMKIGKGEHQVFLGKEIGQEDVASHESADTVSSEIREIIKIAHEKAMSILKEQRELLDKLALSLLKEETLDQEQIFGMIIETVSDEWKDFVNKKYEKAKSIKKDPNELKNLSVKENMHEESETSINDENNQKES